jgi:RHS repeat-associated protein
VIRELLATRYLAEFLGTDQLARSVSEGVDIRVERPAIVIGFVEPAPGAVIPPSQVPIELQVSDTGCARIENVRIFVNGDLLQEFSTGAPFRAELAAFVERRYDLTATVRLSDGRELTAPPRAFFVSASGPVAEVEVTYLHNDAAGSPVAATDAQGAVRWTRGYQPYGEFASATGATGADTRQFFHGKALDADSGLQSFGARFYDPALGRFMAIDPAPWNEANLHSFNRYAFANNNPLRFTDPDGHAPTPLDAGFLIWDGLKLGVAIYTGVGVSAAAADFALSAAGMLVPAPGGRFVLQKVVGKAESGAKAADNAWDSLRSVEQGRDAFGRFLPKNAGEVAPGSTAQNRVWDAIEAKEGWSAVRGNVSVRNAAGDIRHYDGAAVSPRGRVIGLEVKSGEASRNRRQREFDTGVSKSSPAQGVGNDRDREVRRMIEIRTQ